METITLETETAISYTKGTDENYLQHSVTKTNSFSERTPKEPQGKGKNWKSE
jgi:hypothetical protein